MRFRIPRSFWWQVACLLFAACAIILAVMITVYCSMGDSFLVTALRTDILLSVICLAFLVGIGGFFYYVARRSVKEENS